MKSQSRLEQILSAFKVGTDLDANCGCRGKLLCKQHMEQRRVTYCLKSFRDPDTNRTWFVCDLNINHDGHHIMWKDDGGKVIEVEMDDKGSIITVKSGPR